ncbi:MAG TPA: hypothetical protein V6D11_12555 [Waterburya sp.]|jgi:hypothetical protein
MQNYQAAATLVISCPGPEQGEVISTRFGEMRSRDGATLQFTENDAQMYVQHYSEEFTWIENVSDYKVEYFSNPKKAHVIDCIHKLVQKLSHTPINNNGKKLLNLIFIGHGLPLNGALHLRDEVLEGSEFYDIVTSSYKDSSSTLHLDIVLDSCYSSRFLIDVLVQAQNSLKVYPFDCYIAALPDEKAWELSFLEQGAYSFSLGNRGNKYVNSGELAKAIDKQDWRILIKSLQGVTVPNPTSFLTAGKQHSLELVSGHFLEIEGAGRVDLLDKKLSHSGLANTLAIARTAYGEDVEYINDD